MLTTSSIQQSISLTITHLLADNPVLLHGSPGTAKSKGWAQGVAARYSEITGKPVDLITFLPSHKDPVAINGLPMPDAQTRTTETYMNALFAPVADPNGPYAGENPERIALIFVDEIGQLTPAQQPPVFELIQNKIVAERPLPPHTRIIAATNLKTDGALVGNMATPLRNRFVHLRLNPDRVGWIDWAREHYSKPPHGGPIAAKVTNAVAAFLDFKPDAFYTFGDAAKDPSMFAFATARSWEMVIKALSAHASNPQLAPNGVKDLTPDLWQAVAASAVGESVALDLYSFISLRHSLPAMADIEAGRNPSLDPEAQKNPAIRFALASAIADRLADNAEKYTKSDSTGQDQPNGTQGPDKNTLLKRRDNLWAYLTAHTPRDMWVYTIKSLHGRAAPSYLVAQSPDGAPSPMIATIKENKDLMMD